MHRRRARRPTHAAPRVTAASSMPSASRPGRLMASSARVTAADDPATKGVILGDARITLPWSEVKSLIEQAHRHDRDDQERLRLARAAPLSVVFNRASYDATVGEDSTAL